MLTQKYCCGAKYIAFHVVLFVDGNVGAKYIYITSNPRQNRTSDQAFPITFSRNKNGIYVQKVVFPADFERIFEKFQSAAE